MNSLDIRTLEERLVAVLNEYALPLEIKRLVWSEIGRNIEKATTEEIKALANKKESEESEVANE